ncbi:MAG TPA: winged helix DNA-binding domain-containing protein [Candidatus Dormibacteraeota bacterium]
MRTFTAAERRARLVRRHHLAPDTRAADVVDVARDLVALHGTDPAAVFLALRARLCAPALESIEAALYEQRSLIRILAMRRTVFVVTAEIGPVVHAACTREVAARSRKTYQDFLARAGVGDGRWLAEVEASTLRALTARGSAYGGELAADEPRLRQRVMLARGKSYQTELNLTSWVLLLLAADGLIARGRPRGSWVSSQFRWHPIQDWLPGGLGALPTEFAQMELARLWLRTFGPGTAADLRWWTGWTMRATQAALRGAGAVAVDLEGAAGFGLPDDLEPEAAAEPGPALLPALDPTIMGWAGREWYLGERGRELFDRSGNPCPSVWWDGRVVGAWAQRQDGEVAFRLWEDIGREGAAQVAAEAARLRAWLGDVRLAPRTRIPPPIERELTA